MLIKNLCRTALIPVPALFCMMSCVNEEFDFNNGIDTSASINGDLGLPLGSTELIPVGDFLKLDSEEGTESLIKTDDKGDYYFSFGSAEPVAETVRIPSVQISSEDLVQNGGFDIYIGVKSNLPAVSDNTPVTDDMKVDGITLPDTETEITINEDVTDIVSTVKDISLIGLDAPMNVSINLKKSNGSPISKGRVSIRKGMTITFPESVVLEEVNTADYTISGNVLKFIRDVSISGSVYSIDTHILMLDLKKLPSDQGLVGNRIVVDQTVGISGIVTGFSAPDFGSTFGELPEEVLVDISINVTSMEVTYLKAVVSPDVQIEDQTVELGEVPDFLSGNDAVLDIYNPVITLDVSFRSSAGATDSDMLPEFLLTADIYAYDADGNPTMDQPVHIGSTSPDSKDAILVRYGDTRIYLSRRGVDMPSGPELAPVFTNDPLNIIVENLSDIIRTIPSRLVFSNIQVIDTCEGNEEDGYAESDYVDVRFPENGDLEYSFEIGYSMETALAFGEDLNVTYSTEFKDWNGTFNSSEGEGNDYHVNLREAVISFTFVNTIPLAMDVTASPIDLEGNVMDSGSITVELDGTVAPGNIGKESRTDLKILMKATEESLKTFDGLRLNITAQSPDPEYQGVAINKEQGIRLDNVKANIKGEVGFEL